MCSSLSWFILLKFSFNQNKPKPLTTRFSLILRFSLPTNHQSHRATHHSQVRRRDLSPAPPLLLDDSTSIVVDFSTDYQVRIFIFIFFYSCVGFLAGLWEERTWGWEGRGLLYSWLVRVREGELCEEKCKFYTLFSCWYSLESFPSRWSKGVTVVGAECLLDAFLFMKN